MYKYDNFVKFAFVLQRHFRRLTPASPEGARGEAALLARQAAEGSHHLHSVPRFDGVHQVVVQDDVHRARQLAGGGFLWHLLHRDGLVVLVDGEAKLRLQRVVLLILSGTDRGEIREKPIRAEVENWTVGKSATNNFLMEFQYLIHQQGD